MTKTYTQKQYDSAKERAYKKGYEVGERDAKWKLMENEEVLIDYALENAQQVKSWQKWEQFDFDWNVVALVVVCAGVILMMIF